MSRSKRRSLADDACKAVVAELEAIDAPETPSPEWIRAEWARCAADPVYWITTYGWTYDPREDEPDLRFVLFPRQEDYIRWLWEREETRTGGIAEKCRDVGFTWLCGAYAVHRWLFRKSCKIGFGSRKLALVDDSENPDSIFEKLRYLIRRLPAWQVPKGFRESKHFLLGKIINPANGSRIIGEGGDEIGRGGRTTLYFVDEAAFLERADRAVRALSQNSKVVVWVSTPNGVGNAFEQMRHGGAFPVFTFRWKEDPRKSGWIAYTKSEVKLATGTGTPPAFLLARGLRIVYPWYQQQLALWGKLTVAQEIDIDYAASLDNVTIPARYVLAAIDLPLAATGDVTAGLDVAAGGNNETILIFRRGPVVIDVCVSPETNLILQSHWVIAQMETHQAVSLGYDVNGIGKSLHDTWEVREAPLPFRPYAINGGDPASTRKWPNGKASAEFLRNRRAELYWMLRTRFEKAYHYRLFLEGQEGGCRFPDDEMISIPNVPQLLAQLSYPLWFRTETGKVRIESKDEMKKRGVASPDHADALAYTEGSDGGDWTAAAEAIRASLARVQQETPEVW